MANNKKYISLNRLSNFLDNLKNTFAALSHKHTTADITDYKVDTSLSSTSNNPVANSTLDAEFDAIGDAMGALELAIDGKADASHSHNDLYYTESEIDTKLASKSDSTHNHDSKYDAKGSASAVQTNLNAVSDTLDSHTENSNIHVTTTNKSNWNSAYTHSTSAHARTDATKVEDSTTNGNIKINGTETNVYSHPNSGVTAGTYKSVTVNAQGHVTAGTNPTTLAGYGITDAESKGAASSALASAKEYTDTIAEGKADSDHNHDSAYDSKGSASSALASAKTYADSAATTAANNVKNELLNGAGAAYDTLKELGDLIVDNQDAIDALETVAAGKADKTHSHAISDVSGLQSALDGKAASSHGTHVSYSTTAPVMDGTASVGTASTVARSDHKHPTDTSRASKTEFDTHTSNTTVHITSTERSNWNAAKTHADSAHAPSNAEKNQNAFSNITVGSTTVAADSATDTVTFVGSNVTITPDTTNDKITFAVADGSTSAKGIVQLTNSTSSTSTTTAATPNSVKSAYDLANTAKTNAATAQTKADSAYSLAESKVDSLSDLGITATATELNYMDGVTSNVQAQLDGKAASSHTHSYAGSSSAGGAATSANKVNNSLTVKLNGGTTEGTNMFTFNGSAAKAVNITPSAIGAAASSHTHDDRYYTESEVDTKLSGKANTSHGNHVPATQTANNATFLRNDNTWQKVAPANIGATATSVLPNNNGEVKTKFRMAQKGYTNGATWYYKICDLPVNNSSNYASAIISGRIGGWTSDNMSYINSLVWNRGTPSIALMDIAGSATAMSSIWNIADLVLYVNGTSATAANTATLYVKCVNYFTFDLDLELFQSTGNITYDGTYITTTPSGTLAAKSSTTTKRVEIVNGQLLVNGSALAFANHTHNYAGSSSAGGAANSAVKATQDASGNVITSTYATKTELDTAKENLQTSINGKANSSHTHTIANITNLQTTLDGKAASSHTHNYAGSSSAGGAATSANKLNTNAGSTTQPVYFADGVPVKTTYTLGKSVPSDAKFTDTTYSNATTTAAGLMSLEDKTKLNYTNIAYGTCSTAAATAAKVITVSGNTKWALTAGSMITVLFSATNTAQNPTFNVNSTGAKNVYYTSSQITTSNLSYAGYANRPMNFMYDGTQYRFIGWGVDNNSDTKVTQSAAITTAGEYPVILGYSTATTSVTNTVNKTSTLKYNPSTQILTAPTFKGALDGNATTATSATTATKATQDASGNVITSTYETKTAASSKLSEAKTYTDTAISNLINSAPTTLDTLGEIATAMAENADVVEALEDAIGTKSSSTHTHTISHTPAGTVSQPTFTGTAATSGAPSGTTNVYSITAVGSLPSLSASVTNRCLTLTFSAGTLPTKGSAVSVATGAHTHSVTAKGSVSQPTFTGTAATLTSSTPK